MSQDRIWELFSLKLAGEASPEELAELEKFLKEHSSESFKLEKLDTIWQARYKSQPINKQEAFNRHMQRLSNHLSEPVLQYETPEPVAIEKEPVPIRSHRKLYWTIGIAASLITAFVFFTLLNNETSPKSVAHNTVSTKRGSKSKIQLPDGTQVWLNADSRITYNENFQGSKREVELTGEAFFDVVRDEARPFIIHTTIIDVKVLGTSFNVRSYADEKNTETSLIHGSIEVTLVKSADKKKIILKPNDKLIVNNNDASLVNKPEKVSNVPLMTLAKINYRRADSSAVETMWVKNKLAFDEEPLEEIALKIERWYDVKVMIGDESLKQEPYTGTFEHESLREVLDALNAGHDFTYSINKNEVRIKK